MTQQNGNGIKLLGWIPAVVLFASVVGSFSVTKAQSDAVAKGLDRQEQMNASQEGRLVAVETKLTYIQKGVDSVEDQNKQILVELRRMRTNEGTH